MIERMKERTIIYHDSTESAHTLLGVPEGCTLGISLARDISRVIVYALLAHLPSTEALLFLTTHLTHHTYA